MKYILLFCALVSATVLATLLIDRNRLSYLQASRQPGYQTDTYLIKNVQVVPMNRDTVLSGQDVWIEKGIIKAIGHRLSAENATVIEGQGKWLFPGLTDMHVHVWDAYELGLYLANGITTVRNMWGQPHHLRLKQQISSGKIIAPQFFTSGSKLTGPLFIGDDNKQVFSRQQAEKIISEEKEKEYDFIKTYYGLTPELYETVLAEAEKLNLEIAAHPSQEVPYAYHFTPLIKTIEHTEDIVQLALNYQLDSLELQQVVRDFSAHPESAHCPTLRVYYNIYRLLEESDILNDPTLSYMNPLVKMVDSQAQLDRWQNAKKVDPGLSQRILAQHNFHLYILRELRKRQVNIVCGTDAGIGITLPGFSIHKELALYRQAGMSNFEALQTATVNPSLTHAFLAQAGSIVPGKTANLILLEENPLEEPETLKNPLWVMVEGHKTDRSLLELFKTKAADRKNIGISALRYAEYLITK